MQWLMEDLLLIALFGGMMAMLLAGLRYGAGEGGGSGAKCPIRVNSGDGAVPSRKGASGRAEEP